jgi:N-hydroxyarylamine O-acetyltransferase
LKTLLSRICYDGPLTPSVKTLADLKTAFLLAVPFENLDIHIPRKILLLNGAAEKKIVQERRGGFCYECNFLFHSLLTELGFQSEICSSQMVKNGTPMPPFEHMVLLVTVDEARFLVDVGNGESVRTPLDIDNDCIHHTPEGKKYRLRKKDENLVLECFEEDAVKWEARFIVDKTPRQLEEFSDRCEFQQSSPLSVFTKQPMATLALEDGRRTIRGNVFSESRKGSPSMEIIFKNELDYYACLQDKFGLVIRPQDQNFWRP